MHELSLAASAVELIEAAAVREGFSRVRRVRMEIGALSCVEPEALRFAFESAAAGSCAAGAALEFLVVAGEGRCSGCGATAELETVYDPCPACGAHPMQVLRGMEMRVKDLDVE
ncbi:MAG: hydrogenase maturation nickel metallochaperone HypA [Rhodocyclaceae bacterium]|jgi:hydrogenase nickel incorporation protein HypA/HybF|nr:hydrogenase maturation nickel metallochaperone HypA [Rhodocyclaceae bacterium]